MFCRIGPTMSPSWGKFATEDRLPSLHIPPLVAHQLASAYDLLVAAVLVGADGGQFEAIEGALAGQRLAPIPLPLPGLARGIVLADDGGEQWVAAEVVVVVEVLVAQRQAVDPLGATRSLRGCSMRSGLRWSVKQAAN